MLAETMFLYCPRCARECIAEAPPCGDGHSESCPDRACVECGTAVLLDAQLFGFDTEQLGTELLEQAASVGRVSSAASPRRAA